MKRKNIWIVLSLFIIINFSSAENLVELNNNYLINNIYNPSEGGNLEIKNNVKILYLNGSHYEMGFQHGYYLKSELLENLRAILDYSENNGFPYERLLIIWDKMEKHIPEDYINEIKGLADGANISFNDICAMITAFESNGILQCFGMSAWGNATEENELIHFRSFDLPSTIKDPVTGNSINSNTVLIVRKPENGFASLSPSVVGRINGGGGINENGIAIGIQLNWCNDQTFDGIPFLIKLQMVLDYSSSIEEMIEIISNNKTIGWNYIISDSKIPIGYVVETTANLSYIGTWNNPVESISPFWEIKNVVRRTNLFIDPKLAATQRERYDPSGLIGFIKLLLGSYEVFFPRFEKNKVFDEYLIFPIWRNYLVVSNEIEKNWGSLDLNSTILLFRDVYSGKTDFLLKIMGIFSRGHGFMEPWSQWVAYPKNGDILVSFSSEDNYAFENEINYFNLYDLIES